MRQELYKLIIAVLLCLASIENAFADTVIYTYDSLNRLAAVQYDTTAPTGTIVINGGAVYTKSDVVNIALSASDTTGVSSMQFSNDAATWTTPESYATNKSWTLASGDGTKTVIVRFCDVSGNWSDAVSATILLDTSVPTTTVSPGEGMYSGAQNVTLSCADGIGAGCDAIYYTTDGTTPIAGISAVYSTPLSLLGSETLKFLATDRAGNVESVKTAVYTVGYPVTYTAGSNGSLTGTTSQSVANNGNATAVTAVPSANYHLVNWTGTGAFLATTANPLTVTNVTTSQAITANFAINTFAVNYATDVNGTLAGTASQTVDYGGSATAVTAVPTTGYHFVNWTGTGGFVTTTTNPLTVGNVSAAQTITANFALNIYAVSFAAGANGTLTGTASQTVNYGGNSTAVTAVPAANYHWLNWTGTGGFITTASNPLTVTNVTAAQTITANFGINTFTVNYATDVNGTLAGTASQSVNYGGSATAVSAIPTTGYHFVNWTGTGGFVTSTANPLTVGNVTAAQTITANFAINSYGLSFAAGANGTLTGTASQTVNYGGSTTAVTAVPATNYHLVNWTGTGGFVTTNSNPLTVTNVSAAQAITANFANTFAVGFVAGAVGTLSGNANQTLAAGASATAVTALPGTGYHFVNWTGTGGFVTSTANPLTVTNVRADQTITANFAPNPYVITLVAGAHGTLTGTLSQTVTYGSSGTAVTAVPAANYHFVNWTGTGGFVATTANPLTVSNVTVAQTITANFAINTFAVKLVAGPNGTLSGTASQTVNYGGSSTAVSAVTATGYHFVNWTGTGGFVSSTTNPLTVTNVTADQTITANFAVTTFALTFAAAGTNGTLIGTTSQIVNYGASATTVTAVPVNGYRLYNWTGTGGFVTAYANPLTVSNVTATWAITANFAPLNIYASAGNGTAGYTGDGGAATSASINSPEGIAVDGAGNLYIADMLNNRVRKVAVNTGIITTVAGNGTEGFSGDGGAATSASLDYPDAVAVDGAGNLYIADARNSRIRKVAAGSGIISTVAGSGAGAISGDGGPATSATIGLPTGVAVDGAGNIYFADPWFSHAIRKVDAGTGIITTVAGNGTLGFTGDGGAATSASLRMPNGVSVDRAGNLYIADTDNNRIRKVAVGTGIITTVAGGGTLGFPGDGGPATSASLNSPESMTVDEAGNLYIADDANNRIRKVAAGTGIITTHAGNGTAGYNGDGLGATSGEINSPQGVAADGVGDLYIADYGNNRIRKLIGGSY